jgi:hypothetical protein
MNVNELITELESIRDRLNDIDDELEKLLIENMLWEVFVFIDGSIERLKMLEEV